jgi:hypothetical protein
MKRFFVAVLVVLCLPFFLGLAVLDFVKPPRQDTWKKKVVQIYLTNQTDSVSM